MDPIEQTRAGPVLRVRVKPNAQRDAVLGVTGGALKVSVRAAPEKGKANTAVCKTIARWLDLPPSALSVTSGGAGRDKRIAVDAPDLAARLARALDQLA